MELRQELGGLINQTSWVRRKEDGGRGAERYMVIRPRLPGAKQISDKGNLETHTTRHEKHAITSLHFLADVKLNPFKDNPRNLTVSQARQSCESSWVLVFRQLTCRHKKQRLRSFCRRMQHTSEVLPSWNISVGNCRMPHY